MVPLGLDLLGSCPADAVIAGLREVDVRVLVGGRLAADEAHHHVVGRARTRRRAIGDVDAGCRGEVAASAGDAIDRGAALDVVEDPRLMDGADDRRLGRPGRAAVVGHRHQLEGLPAGGRNGPDAEGVCVALAVVSGRRDLVLRPCGAAVVGDGHLECGRGGVALRLALEHRREACGCQMHAPPSTEITLPVI